MVRLAERQRSRDAGIDDPREPGRRGGNEFARHRFRSTVAPSPSAIAAFSVLADSISAMTVGAIPSPAQASFTSFRTTL